MSAASQPNFSRMSVTSCFAPGSLPQMNIVGIGLNGGLTMNMLPTLLNALTSLACGALACRRSISDSFAFVK